MKEKKQVPLNELKAIEIDILQTIHDFCQQKGLKYFLSSGTLLGAIRHKGFIPWDDDADVMMPRPDYDIFMKDFKSEKYVMNYPCKPGYYQSIIKLADKNTELIQDTPLADQPIGVHIDILPLDGEPENLNKYVEHVGKMIDLYTATFVFRNSIIKNIVHPRFILQLLFKRYQLLRKGLTLSRIYEKVEKLAHKYSYEESPYVGYITMSNYRYKQRHRKELFEEAISVEFEGRIFNAPKGYDEYLRNLFGDYMQLPPIEQRKSTHFWTAYYKL